MNKAEIKEFAVAVVRVFVFAAVPLVAAVVVSDGLDSVLSVEGAKALGLAAAAAGVRAVYGAVRSGQIPFPGRGV
jgi:hypothetical protein